MAKPDAAVDSATATTAADPAPPSAEAEQGLAPASPADPSLVLAPEPTRAFVVLSRDHGALTVGTVLDLPGDVAATACDGADAPARPATSDQVAIAQPRIVRAETL